MTLPQERIHRALTQLYSLSDFETRRTTPYTHHHYNLSGISALLERLDNPHHHFKSYHIVGTKGKGSTAFYLTHLLTDEGVRVGTYTSPHIFDIRERVAIDGNPIDWLALIPALEQVLLEVARMDIPVTLFDVLTATAFLIMREQNIEIAVLEAGLGGRWDSTNVLTPANLIATLVTRIDYDHMDKLGATLTAIAREKAAVIKPGVPVFYLDYPDRTNHDLDSSLAFSAALASPDDAAAVDQVFIEKARQTLTVFHNISPHHPKIAATLKQASNLPTSTSSWAGWFPNVLKENLALACAVMESTQGVNLTTSHIAKLIDHKPPLGRYTQHRNVLLDGAHTPLSLKYLVHEVLSSPRFTHYQAVTFCFYAFFDKAIENLVEQIPTHWDFVFCHIDLPFVRTERRAEVCARAKRTRLKLRASFREVSDLAALKIFKSEERLFVCAGSFKLIAAFYQQVFHQTSVLET